MLRNEIVSALRKARVATESTPGLVAEILAIAEKYTQSEVESVVADLYVSVMENPDGEIAITEAFCEAIDADFSYFENLKGE